MKRIYERIPVQSILYVMDGNQKIKIFEYENEHDLSTDSNGRCIYNGLVKDTYGVSYARTMASQARGISVKDDVIIFKIFTKFEQY